MASALLLMVSLSMMISASFAWYTLSVAPELSLVSTTVAANGNLEIALVDKDGEEPEKSAVGDSSANQKQSLVDANITWGNLVNLSDNSYGISGISLRPALLSGYNMLRAPLYGATYAADGRVEKVSETYEYVSWYNFGADKGQEDYDFAAGDKVTYGVRAIASVKYSNASGQTLEKEMMSNITDRYQKARELFGNVVDNKVKMGVNADGEVVYSIDALKALLTVYVNEQAIQTLSDKNYNAEYGEVVYYMYNLIETFCQINDLEGEALLQLANLMGLKAGKLTEATFFTTIDQLEESYRAGNLESTYGIDLVSLKDDVGKYFLNRTSIRQARNLLSQYNTEDYLPSKKPTGVKWADISGSVSLLINIDTAMIGEKGGEPFKISDMAKQEKDDLAMMIMGASSEKKALLVTIYDGTLKDTEQRLGSMLNGVAMSIHVYVPDTGISIMKTFDQDVWAKVSTSASENNPPYNMYYSYYDLAAVTSSDFTGPGEDVTAKDIYGMAVDLWLRTNMNNAYLTLEGNVDTTEVQATCVSRDSSVVPVYILSSTDGRTMEAYSLKDKDNVLNWYSVSTHTLLASDADLKNQNIRIEPKMEVVVTGFSGENRVWEDFMNSIQEGEIAEDFTTQGAGSCYIFYANPTDQGRILNLLKAFNIAFLDENGKKIGMAGLDTEHAYAINGKVTVPLMVTEGVPYTARENVDGMLQDVEKTAIMSMEQNKAHWITAIVFLDGTLLTNDQVLDAGTIEGRLNLQFGTSVTPKNAIDNEVRYEKLKITAEASYTAPNGSVQTSSDADDPIELKYDGKQKLIDVKLTILEGNQPGSVSGFFVRSISATQGTRMDSVDFIPNDDGTWNAQFDLSKPGNYLLRSIIVDGVEYMLEKTVVENGETRVQKDYPAVIVDGLGVQEVITNPNGGVIMTADSYVDVNVSIKIDAVPELMPAQVRAVLEGDQGKNYAQMLNYNSNNGRWEGKVRIESSGTFTLNYVVMDGQFRELESAMKREFLVTLGLTARVVCTNLGQVPPQFTGETTLNMQVKILDDQGNELRAMNGVKLYYHSTNSTMDDMGMISEMRWDDSSGWYVGTMLLDEPGAYVFNRVEVDKEDSTEKNYIYSATTAPKITSLPKEPPEYVANATNDYQFVPNNQGRLLESGESGNSGAIMGVWLRNAEGSDLWALMRNTKGTTDEKDDVRVLVPSKMGIYRVTQYTANQKNDGTIYYFDVPKNSDAFYPNMQDGQWVLEAVCMQNVYLPGETEDESIIIAPPGTPTPNLDNYTDPEICYLIELEGNTTKVVETVNVDVMKGDTRNYTGEPFSGKFLEAHTSPEVSFQLTDWQSKPVSNAVNSVVWTLAYDEKTDTAYGSYDGAAEAARVLEIKDPDGDGIFVASKQTLIFSGEYKTTALKFTYAVNGINKEATINNKNVTFKVSSTKPDVTVSSVTPGVSDTKYYFTATPGAETGAVKNTGLITGPGSYISPDKHMTAVYITTNDEGYSITLPQVTLALGKVGSNFTSATMSFPNNKSADKPANFTFKPNSLTSKATVGSGSSGSAGIFGYLESDATIFPAGRQTLSTITVTANDVSGTARTLTATLEAPVTIDQPQYPRFVTYVTTVNGVTVPGVPTTKVAAFPNAEGTFSIILPETRTWTSTEVWQDEDLVFELNRTRTHKGYTWNNVSGCDAKYDLWTMTETEYVAEGMKYSRTDTHVLTQWKIGSKNYQAGTEYKMTGNTTVTATFTTTPGSVVSEPGARNVYYDWVWTLDKDNNGNNNNYTANNWGTLDTDLTKNNVVNNHSNTVPFGGSW